MMKQIDMAQMPRKELEKFAMEALAKKIDRKYDGIPVQYFECGDLFTYDR